MPLDASDSDVGELFSNENCKTILLASIQDVFSTMMSLEVAATQRPPIQRGDATEPMNYFPPEMDVVVGMIGFLGKASGVLYFYLEEKCARRLAASLLNMTGIQVESEGIEMINDALGELCNMMAGGFRNQVCEAGYDCRLTIPSIIRGSRFSVEMSSEAYHYTYPFTVGNELLVVALIAKTD